MLHIQRKIDKNDIRFLAKNNAGENSWATSLKYWEKENIQRILYPVKVSSKIKGEIKTFLDTKSEKKKSSWASLHH